MGTVEEVFRHSKEEEIVTNIIFNERNKEKQ